MLSTARPPFPWPTYRKIPHHLNLSAEVLERQIARNLGPQPALVWDSGWVSYQTLYDQTRRLSAALNALGIRRGDLALVCMPNSLEFAVSFLALVKLGVVPVLINSFLTVEELKNVLDQAQPSMAITASSRAAAIREVSASSSLRTIISAQGTEKNEIAFDSLLTEPATDTPTAETLSDEPAFIVYTSGTTGKPKGIVHAHRWIIALGDLNRLRLPPLENDVVMATGEWSFISALGHNLLFPLRNGVTGAVLSQRATPKNVLGAITRHRVTVLYSVATVYRRLLAMPGFEKQFNLESLRCAHSTGEALREATYYEWRTRVGCELYEHYGVSEYQLVIGQGSSYSVKPGSVGKPLAGLEVAILDDDFKPVPIGELGQFAISSKDPGLFLGYTNDPARTEAAIRKGWYFTGDLAYQDEDGYVFIAGRRDDCFKSRGIFISPTEIENALQRHPAIVEAAVVAEPDPEVGNRILALAVLRDPQHASDQLAQSLRESLRSQIAPFKVPHSIEFVDRLPKNAVGKIIRSALGQKPR
jgi:acyl-coenzyme A synthetase/AMP-(fatty) acid ligase